MRGLLILAIFLIGPFAVQAVLPADAGFREKEIFAYRQRKEAENEQIRQRHDALMVVRDRQIQQEMATPPWGGIAGSVTVAKTGKIFSEQHKAGSERSGRKWMVSIIALLFIGSCVWWVRVKTESEPDR